MEVMIRGFQKTDEPFIFSSWAKNHYYGNKTLKKNNSSKKKEWFRNKCKEITEMLLRGHVRVACLKEDPNVIIGYSVFLGQAFEFAYVKENYREPQILEILMKRDPNGK
jgi:hypothetical protein